MIQEVISNLWEGFIPLELELYQGDLTTSNAPHSYFVHVSRYSYLPVVINDAVQYFQDFAIDFSSDIWFEYDEMPLKCHIPIGVLYDCCNIRIDRQHLPWKVHVHFHGLPKTILMKCDTPELAERYYSHSLKQALYLIYGTTRIFNDITIENQNMLWRSINMGIYESYYQNIKPTIPTYSKEIKYLPVRILSAHMNNLDPMIQRPIKLVNPISSELIQTNSNLISSSDMHREESSELVEIILENEKVSNATMLHELDTGRDKTIQDLLTENQNYLNKWKNGFIDITTIQVIIQGIEIPLQSNLYFIWQHFHHADLFLYIVIQYL